MVFVCSQETLLHSSIICKHIWTNKSQSQICCVCFKI